MQNRSPWIHQLNQERKIEKLRRDLETDVAVIGAGIAGVSTAFFLLKYTDKKVALIEGYRLAHGATGHNAGQVTSYFERPFSDIVREFGLEKAVEGQKSIESAWELVDEMYTEAGLDIPFSRFIGSAGYSSKEQVLRHLENDFLRRKGGLHTKVMEIWEDADFVSEIPEEYHDLFTLVSKEEIALRLETLDPQYVAVSHSQKGVMNSALFSQEIVSFLSRRYPDRFTLFEETPIQKIVIHEKNILLDALHHTVSSAEVVLCTNGFENFDIFTSEGLSLNTRFHHSLYGVVGFMAAYLEPGTNSQSVLSYYEKRQKGNEPYFYVTRRSYEYEPGHRHNLVSVGGPEFNLDERGEYDRNLEFSAEAKGEIERFVERTYDKRYMDYLFMWHGVMGYTKNLLRLIGRDPHARALYYNLGCNGVGLLPSIFGGHKVAKEIAGERFPPSIFDIPAPDPEDQKS